MDTIPHPGTEPDTNAHRDHYFDTTRLGSIRYPDPYDYADI